METLIGFSVLLVLSYRKAAYRLHFAIVIHIFIFFVLEGDRHNFFWSTYPNVHTTLIGKQHGKCITAAPLTKTFFVIFFDEMFSKFDSASRKFFTFNEYLLPQEVNFSFTYLPASLIKVQLFIQMTRAISRKWVPQGKIL